MLTFCFNSSRNPRSQKTAFESAISNFSDFDTWALEQNGLDFTAEVSVVKCDFHVFNFPKIRNPNNISLTPNLIFSTKLQKLRKFFNFSTYFVESANLNRFKLTGYELIRKTREQILNCKWNFWMGAFIPNITVQRSFYTRPEFSRRYEFTVLFVFDFEQSDLFVNLWYLHNPKFVSGHVFQSLKIQPFLYQSDSDTGVFSFMIVNCW